MEVTLELFFFGIVGVISAVLALLVGYVLIKSITR
jgi:hypothetical protein